MTKLSSRAGIGTIVTHLGEMENPGNSHVMPIYQSSAFILPDVSTGQSLFKDDYAGYYYTRLGNPNARHLASKIAALEGLEILRGDPGRGQDSLVMAEVFSSGMAATTAAFASLKKRGRIISQSSVYGGTFTWLNEIAERFGFQVTWLRDFSVRGWEQAFAEHGDACVAYVETPANPMVDIVDLSAVAEIAHRAGAWMMVDNTFATPVCQRPLNFGADVVIHSTTKYLSGHGAVIGGAVVSRHPDYVRKDLHNTLKTFGASPSPFDCWLANLGMKTLELRVSRHCENAMALAHFLKGHSAVSRVLYPGLPDHPGHAVAAKQMSGFGGMLSFELKGGLQAGVSLMERVKICTLAVSLGNVDTLIQHPASMTHHSVPAEDRLKMGITDGLVRLSVGIENTADLVEDLGQALV
jgi:methionine-gamma-lyase